MCLRLQWILDTTICKLSVKFWVLYLKKGKKVYFFITESSVMEITLPLINCNFLARGRAYSKKESSVMEITLIQGCFSYVV